MYITISNVDVIEVVLSGAAVNAAYYSTYSTAPTLAINNGNPALAGTYQLMPPSGGGGNINNLFGVTIYNASAANSLAFTVRYNNTLSVQNLFVGVLPPGFIMIYDGGPGPGSGQGWEIYDTAGNKR